LNNLISSQSGQLKAAGYHNKVCQPLLDKTSKSSILLYEGNKGYGLEFSWHYKAITGLKLFFIAISTLFFIASLGPNKNGPDVHSDFEQVDNILEKCISKSHS